MSDPASRVVDLTLVVPAYNEELRLLPTLERLHAFLSAQPMRYEILVVDDGSRDNTCEVVEAAACASRTSPRAPAAERGQGRRGPPRHARRARSDPRDVRRRLLDAAGAAAAPARADHRLQSGDRDRLALRRGCEDRRQAAVLSRAVDPPARTRSSSARWSRACATRSAASRRSPPRRRANLFRRAKIDGWAFDLEILALARRRGFAIEEVGVEWKDDNRSRINPLKDMWKVIREALTIRRNLARGVYCTASL